MDGMLKPKLFVGRSCNLHASRHKVASLIRHDFEAQSFCIHDDKTITTIRSIDDKCTEPFDLQRYRKLIGKRRNIGDGNSLGLSITTISPGFDQATRRFHHQFRFWLCHGDDTSVEYHSSHTDGIGSRHRWSVSRLHDDPADLGIRMFRGNEKVDVPEHTPTRLVEYEPAETFILLDKTTLLPKGVTWWRCDSANNDIANFPFGMAPHYLDGAGCPHFSQNLEIIPAPSLQSFGQDAGFDLLLHGQQVANQGG